jgi:cobalt/nickel transport system permease protein
MRHDYLDRYSRLDSPLHKLPAGMKLALAIALVLGTVAVPFHVTEFFVAAAAFLGICFLLSGIPLRFVVTRLLLLEPFVAGVALLALLQPGGGLVAAGVLVKSNLSLATMLLLSNTTPFGSLLEVLRMLRVPALLITVLSLLYRYLFVLVDQAERMARARRSRTFSSRRASRWRTGAGIVGQLFITATERAERIYAAMTARGWR